MKTIPIRYCIDVLHPEERKGNLLKIGGNGMGFVMIHRRVFNEIARRYPQLKYTPSTKDSNYPPSQAEMNNSYHYFNELKKDMAFLPEDFSFFERASSVGFTSWLDTSIKLCHVGSHVFQENK